MGKPDYVCVCAGGGEMVRARLATASSLGWEAGKASACGCGQFSSALCYSVLLLLPLN